MPTKIPPPDSHFITLAQFLAMRQAYSVNSGTILAPQFQGQNILCTSELFNVAAISAVTAVPGCAAVRIYYGMDAALQVHAMLVATDSNGVDILPANNNSKAVPAGAGDPPIVEEGQRCPPECP